MATWQPPSDKCTARTRRSVRRPRERGHGSVWIGRWKEEDISDSLLWEREWGPFLGELLTVADSLLPPLWLLKLLRFAWIDYPLLVFIFKLWYLDVRLTLLPLILYRPPVTHKCIKSRPLATLRGCFSTCLARQPGLLSCKTGTGESFLKSRCAPGLYFIFFSCRVDTSQSVLVKHVE